MSAIDNEQRQWLPQRSRSAERQCGPRGRGTRRAYMYRIHGHASAQRSGYLLFESDVVADATKRS